jgi:hypothetical protein
MKDFISPVKYGKLLSISIGKKYIYGPESNDRIIAPYDGVINEIDSSKCNGFIRLQHYVNGNIYYSEICGINSSDIFVSIGMKVSQGEMLSKCGSENIIYEIKDSRYEKLPLMTFFTLSSNKKEDTEKEEKKKEEKKKEENKKEENKKEENKKEENKKEENKKGWKPDFSKKIMLPDLFTTALLTPIDFANKALSSYKGKKETKEEDEEKLMEEIKRIKKLLK